LAERQTGINDPALGRETRMGGHPAPATSTLALLHEGKKLDIIAMRTIRASVSKLGMDLATLYQQFGTAEDGKITRAVGEGDAKVVQEYLFPTEQPIYGNLELDLAAMSETMNPEVEQSKALLAFQASTNYFALVQQHLAVASNPQSPESIIAVSLKAIESLGKSYEKILETNDVDQLEAYNIQFKGLLQKVASEHQQANQQQQQQQQPPPPGGGGAGPSSNSQGGVPQPSVGGNGPGAVQPSGGPAQALGSGLQ
jgi:hypothetical protein